MLTREELKPWMRVKNLTKPVFGEEEKVGIIRPDPRDPEKILVAATADLSLIPVIIKGRGSTVYDWWPLSDIVIARSQS